MVDDDLFLGIERVKSMFQSLKMDRTGNPFGAEHAVIQTIDQLEVPAAISAKIRTSAVDCTYPAFRMELHNLEGRLVVMV